MTEVFDPLRFGAIALDVMAVSRAASDAIAARQASRLQRILAAAQSGSKLYRERLQGVDVDTVGLPLASIPAVTRSELMHRFDEWVTDPRIRLDELRAFTQESACIGDPYLGKYMVWESSGTSGEPGIFLQDAQNMAVYDALETLRRSVPRSLSRWMDPLCLSERVAFVGVTGGYYASYVTFERLRRLNPWMAQNARSFSILQPIDALVGALNDFSPTVVATYPTSATLLADEAMAGRLKINVREVWTGGENLNMAVRERIQQGLGCTVSNSYGASEFLAMGWECGAGKLHVNADWLILEPVDEHYQPVPVGEPSSTVLLTHLANAVQPLIRYDLGDQVTFSPNTCVCGSFLPVVDVCGRRDDALVMVGRNGCRVKLLPLALTTVLEEQAGVFDFQLQQKDDRTLTLRLGLSGQEAMAAMVRCARALKAFAQTQGLASVHVVEELDLPVQRESSGKIRRVIARTN